MTQNKWWLAWLIVIGSVLAGCAALPDFGGRGTPATPEPAYVRQISIKETTVDRLGNGWNVGLETMWNGRYVDDEGNERAGRVARIGVWNVPLEINDTLEVYEGMIFSIGDQRFQVIELKRNSSLSIKPGSSNGYIVIGQLP